MVSAQRGRVEQVKQDLKNWLRRLALSIEVEAVWELYWRYTLPFWRQFVVGYPGVTGETDGGG